MTTNWQRTALAFPCRFAEETSHKRYLHLLGNASVVMTVNSLGED